jgi:uncharacterized RDD family membrane protein YckC
MGGGMGSGMPSWSANLTARGTMPGPGGVALADIPDRAIAFVIDAIILGVIGYIISYITTQILGEELLGGIFGISAKVPTLLSTIVAVALLAAVSAGYFIYTWTRMGGQTVGMKVTKIRVVDGASGGPVSQQQAISRWLYLGLPLALYQFWGWSLIGWLIALVAFGFLVYEMITVAQSPTRQGFHDKAANTAVAKMM